MKVRLTALCPIHIGGSDQRIGPLEFVLLDGRCFVIHREKLLRTLGDKGLLDPFVETLSGARQDGDLAHFLREHGLLSSDFLAQHSAYSSACAQQRIREVRGFIRSVHAQPYLPGSAVKGVVRTSILYTVLDRLDPALRTRMLDEFVRKRLSDFESDPRCRMRHSWFREQFKQWFAQELDRHFFQRFEIGPRPRRFSPRSDVMRAILVSDGQPLGKDDLRVEEVKIHSARSGHSPKDWSIWAECVQSGSQFTFDLTVDTDLLSQFAESTSQPSLGAPLEMMIEVLSNPLEAVAHMTKALFKHELAFYEQESLPTEALGFRGITPNFRLGWGIGMLGTSVSLLLPPQVVGEIRNALFVDRGDAPAPKSRKTVLATAGNHSLGWCFVEKEH